MKNFVMKMKGDSFLLEKIEKKWQKILFVGIVILLGTLLAQVFVIVLSLLSIAKGINIPFLVEKITINGESLFRVTPILLIISYTFAIIIAKYSIYRKLKHS